VAIPDWLEWLKSVSIVIRTKNTYKYTIIIKTFIGDKNELNKTNFYVKRTRDV